MEIAQLLALVLGPAGAAWVGVKVSLNGMRESVGRIETKVGAIEEKVHENSVSIARLQEH